MGICIDLYVSVVGRKQGCSHVFEYGGALIMGPWSHVGGSDHTFTIRLPFSSPKIGGAQAHQAP